MNALDDLKFVIGALIVLAIAWFTFGFDGSDVRGPFVGGLGNNERISQRDGDDSGKQDGNISDEIDNIEENLDIVEKEFQKAKLKTNASPYQGLVEISRSRARDDDPDEEYIKLEVSRDLDRKISITGWRILSPVTGRSVEIKKGSYLPYSARVNSEEAIWVEADEEIYLVSGRSPIGVSFRINKCTGYFEQFQDFEPRLPKKCPEAIDDLFRYMNEIGGRPSDQCVDFVEDLDRCEIYLRSVPSTLSGSCNQYITEKVNYNTCVDFHKNDSDFKGKEWRVYLGQRKELWKDRREVIKLVDKEGKTIDAITY